MSYPDPMTPSFISTVTYGAATNFVRVGEGRYYDTSSTLDEAKYLEIANTVNGSGISSFVVKHTWSKNAPGTIPYGSQPQPDDVAQVHLVVRQPHRSFTAANMATMRDLVGGFVFTSALWDRLLRGEK